ncbi:MAG: beta-lactamase-like protein 2 [Deltaproteobacteria bacterium]|nr:MAG: beta-lactamase-like protein 2 [Deltaproteobacteria bacterium]
MSTPPRPNTMIGLTQPDVSVWSERVAVALGMNPGLFTGPGTNTFLVGTGRRRILIDAGDGRSEYLPVLERTLERAGCEGLQEIVLTHGHPDHIGGAAAVVERFGPLRVSKLPWPGNDERYPIELTPLEDGCVIRTEGATLRGVHTPGHARDHLCFVLEEEASLFSGDNVLGVGTTVIPPADGSLVDYMASLDRLLEEAPRRIYPAHGPRIDDGVAKLREYVDHRNARETQILAALAAGSERVPDIVRTVYTDVPEVLHAAAGHSVTSHLLKLEHEGRARRTTAGEPLRAHWTRR